MIAAKRPLGVMLLSLVAYLTSASLFYFTLKGLFAFVTQVGLQLIQFQEEPGRYIAALFAIMVFFSCLLVLAGIVFVAGHDLWLLRARGRRLTVVTMILVLALGSTLLFAMLTDQSEAKEKMIASAMCVVSSISLLYLFLPRVKRVFARDSVPTS